MPQNPNVGNNNMMYNPPVGQQGSVTQYGGGGGYPISGFRSILDARIAAATGKTPEAQYPDGYIGSVIDRRQDKLLQTVRNNARSYTRGVHKGSRIGAQDYFWPDDLTPFTTLEKRLQGDTKRFAQEGNPLERLAHGGKFITSEKAAELARELNITHDPQMKVVSPELRQFHAAVNLPGWSSTGSGRSV
jgi:hypothetical protein